jgi:hypothetical protein
MAGMKKYLLLVLLVVAGKWASAQSIDSIYFHLYTDSLKKGFYNYINVDGKTADGRWIPLTANEVVFSTNGDTSLRFQNNDLFIDSTYRLETVTVKAALKSNPKICKEVTIYIRKRGFDEPLKTNAEVLEEYSKQPAKKQKGNQQ